VLILPITLTVMSSSFSTSAAAGIRALGAARRSLRAQLFASGMYAVGGISGAAVGGAVGSAWGLTAAVTVSAANWWWQLRRGMRAHRATTTPDVPDPESSSTASSNTASSNKETRIP
jgi:hypothetical protein